MQHDNETQRNEHVSALLDNDLKRDELNRFMDDLKRDPLAEGETLQRYQLIGKTLRGELDAAMFIDVSAAVQRAIAQESLPANVHTLRPRRWPDLHVALSGLMRPVAGLAIAASVAMVTVVSVRMLQQAGPAPAGQTLAAVTPAPVVPVNPQRAQQVQVVANSTVLPAPSAQQAPRLNDYLMRHSGVAGQATMQGVMPYARAVSFDQEGAR